MITLIKTLFPLQSHEEGLEVLGFRCEGSPKSTVFRDGALEADWSWRHSAHQWSDPGVSVEPNVLFGVGPRWRWAVGWDLEGCVLVPSASLLSVLPSAMRQAGPSTMFLPWSRLPTD